MRKRRKKSSRRRRRRKRRKKSSSRRRRRRIRRDLLRGEVDKRRRVGSEERKADPQSGFQQQSILGEK